MDHTSGLEDLRIWQLFSQKASPSAPLALAFQRDPGVLKVRTRPGSTFSYSNMGYTLLAMVVEALTGTGYESYLDQQLLRPIGMHNSTFGFVSQAGNVADTSLAMGHLDNRNPFPALPIYLRPAAQFTTTAADMGVFLRFLMGDGTLNGETFVATSLLRGMGKAEGTDAVRNGLGGGYGLALLTRDRHSMVGLAHSGNIVGYHAMIYLFPHQQKAFFISHNMDSESADYEKFNKILLEHLNPASTGTASAIQTTTADARLSGYYVPVVSRFQPMAYLETVTRYQKLGVEADKVTIAPFLQPERSLRHLSGGLLQAEGRALPSHVVFEHPEYGTVVSDGLTSMRKTRGFYLLLLASSLLLGWAGLLYVLVSGVVRWVQQKGRFFRAPVSWSFAALLLLLVPVPLFFLQTFASMGDLTPASVALALATILLPLALLVSMAVQVRRGMAGLADKLDFFALAAALQWIAVLLWWELIPFYLWTA